MIFVAVLVLLALFTPESAPDAVDRLFVEAELVSRGGYVGAGIAWVGLRLFGQVISCIIMLGVILWLVTLAISIVFVMRYAKKVKADKVPRFSRCKSRKS